ncbi:MAG: 2OG-Fe dioxygenase family protein [Rhodanobacteraceae bacterium]
MNKLEESLARDGHALVQAGAMREALERYGALTDWAAFSASWDGLHLDTHMADHGRYRRRRHAVYEASAAGEILRAVHQPHYQSREYNVLNGGVARWFEPIAADIGGGPCMLTILRFCHVLFAKLAGVARTWHIEAHQFRIEAAPDMHGLPTPEGIHRDGVDYVLVLLIHRRNIASGTTLIHTPDGRLLGSFTLTRPFDAALIDDRRVHHGVTAVTPLDPALPAYRDVLVVTFRGK